MIFVITGTQKFEFNRLLKAMDELLANKKITDKVFAQTGYSTYIPQNYEYSQYLPMQEFDKHVSESSLIVCHSGGAAINTALKAGKKVVAVPRLEKFNEHVDDHQLEIAKKYGEANFLEVCHDIGKLDEYIEIAKKKEFATLENSKDKIVDIIGEWLKNGKVKSSCILGINLIYEPKNEWMERVSSLLNKSDSKLSTIYTINTEFLAKAAENNEYHKILQESEINVIDGLPVSLFVLLRKGKFLHRICGSDFIYDLLKICEDNSKKILFLGGTEHRQKLAVDNVKKLYPRISVLGYSPAFPAPLNVKDDFELQKLIETEKPQAIAVCFGTSKQEEWINANKNFLEENGVKLATGMGGVVDFVSGEIKRAPGFFRVFGMEWLWRCLLEPFRIKKYAKSAWVLGKYVIKPRGLK
jgi:exopolysaccharide biosynthesis WecB/TagA/CpsF family protein